MIQKMSIKKRRDEKLKSYEETLDHILDTYLPETEDEYSSSDDVNSIYSKRELVEDITGILYTPKSEDPVTYVSRLKDWMDTMIRRDNDLWEPERRELEPHEGWIQADYYFDSRMDPENIVDPMSFGPEPPE